MSNESIDILCERNFCIIPIFDEMTAELFIRFKKILGERWRKYTRLMAPHVTPPLTAAVDNNIEVCRGGRKLLEVIGEQCSLEGYTRPSPHSFQN